MAMLDVNGSSLPEDSQAKSDGLVSMLPAIWRSVCIHQMNVMSSHNGHNGLTMTTAP